MSKFMVSTLLILLSLTSYKATAEEEAFSCTLSEEAEPWTDYHPSDEDFKTAVTFALNNYSNLYKSMESVKVLGPAENNIYHKRFLIKYSDYHKGDCKVRIEIDTYQNLDTVKIKNTECE